MLGPLLAREARPGRWAAVLRMWAIGPRVLPSNWMRRPAPASVADGRPEAIGSAPARASSRRTPALSRGQLFFALFPFCKLAFAGGTTRRSRWGARILFRSALALALALACTVAGPFAAARVAACSGRDLGVAAT